ncbi:hypothetical protein SFRURICE_019714, partial [Spodoptera frugiperda]
IRSTIVLGLLLNPRTFISRIPGVVPQFTRSIGCARAMTGLENLAKDCLSRISRWGERNRLTFSPHKTYQLLLKGNLKSWPSIKFNNVPVKRKESVCYLGLVLEKNFSFIEHIKTISEKAKNNFYALTRISTIYGATYLGCVCYGAPVWADRATIGAVRRKLLQGQRLALIFLCKAYRTVSTEALPVLAGLLPVDLEVQRRAAMYYNARPNFSANFLAQRDRSKIDRLLKPLTAVWDELLTEWQFILSPALNSPREVETIVFFSSPLITSSDLFRCGIQDSHSFPWDAPDFSVPILAYRSCSGMGGCGGLVQKKKKKKVLKNNAPC